MYNNSLHPHYFWADLQRFLGPISSSTSLQPWKSEAPKYEWCTQSCAVHNLCNWTWPGYATIISLLWYRTYLRPSRSQVGIPLSFPESVSYLNILSLINHHFVKALFLFPTVASPGHCPRGEVWELSRHGERLCEEMGELKQSAWS